MAIREIEIHKIADITPATSVNRFTVLEERLHQARHEEIELPERAFLDLGVRRLGRSLRKAIHLPGGAEPVLEIANELLIDVAIAQRRDGVDNPIYTVRRYKDRKGQMENSERYAPRYISELTRALWYMTDSRSTRSVGTAMVITEELQNRVDDFLKGAST